ncbi:hypothetical protein BEI46_15535 [Aliivibrio fischeri]|nr:hypothetical protein BEI46_15535 [Aliivibrio fischeri]
MIRLHMFQSGYGDSLLVRVSESGKRSANILVDLGFCYKDILKEIKGILGKELIDRFIITHFDSDHIQGACSLLEENGESSSPVHLKIDQVWLNSYRHLQFFDRSDEEISTVQRKRLTAYIASKSRAQSKEGNISAAQASRLASQVYKNNYEWNTDADGRAICIENIKTVALSNDVKLTVLTPNADNLRRQEKVFIADLRKVGLTPISDEIFDDAFELCIKELEEYSLPQEKNVSSSRSSMSIDSIVRYSEGHGYKPDDSIGNGGSISFILETENKKILFLADAYAEDVMREINNLYKDKEELPIYFDAIKISHHGSFRNNPPELFKLIDSKRFLFSTNGKHPKHKHPDIETIACIINRDLPIGLEKRILHFNYELEHLKGLDNEDLKNKFNYGIEVGTEVEIS